VIKIYEISLITGIFIGYIIGVLKEKARWIEKFINSRQARDFVEEEE